MKLRVLGCSGGQVPGRKLSCFLVDDSLLLDAGSASSALSLRAQENIKDVLITHIHLDHVLSLGMLADNLYGKCQTSINLWGTAEIIEGLKKYFFNDHIWPDFTRLTDHTQCVPVMRLCELLPEQRTEVGNHAVTPVRVNHVIPTLAYFLENRDKTLLHIGDTAATDAVWRRAQNTAGLCAIVVETSFPNRLQDIADSSLHLTPQSLARELEKLGNRDVPILVTHLKPAFRKEIVAELKHLKDSRVRILRDGDVLKF
ncbi:MAG TPA: 3',5'-cyclic-nucleotide phosphodiesterase [Candidatus Binatia bacterium]